MNEAGKKKNIKLVAYPEPDSYKAIRTTGEEKRHMKTKEELNALKNDVEALNKKLSELTDDELKEVAGGAEGYITIDGPKFISPLLR